jgi:hypothetical protein
VVVGGLLGRQTNSPYNYTGAVIGPHTATGSGKITLWDKQGLYGTTLDAVDNSAGGLVPTNTSLFVGAALTFTSEGLLTPGTGTVVARFAGFETNGSRVTTPSSMVVALGSPATSASAQYHYTQAVYWYSGAGGE